MKSNLRILVTLSALLLFVGACGPGGRVDGDDAVGDDDDTSGFVDARTIDEFGPDAGGVAEECTKMDFLFIVDDSGSMGEEQMNLAQNFPAFINVINAYVTASGQPLDYRIAVTTTGRDIMYNIEPIPGFSLPTSESGDDGAFRMTGSCGMTRRWFERTDANVPQNFACAANVGTGGPSIEMPLYAIDLALSDRVADGTNANFLREDALLAIVILTDENDCSREDNNFTVVNDACDSSQTAIQPVSKYITFLDTLKGERGRWAAAVIAGPTNCSSAFGDAIEATRLKEFVAMTGTNAVFSSICEGNLTMALTDALETFQAACASFPDVE